MMINRLRDAAWSAGGLFPQLGRGVARAKSKSGRMKQYAKQPDLFRLTKKVRRFDFRKPDVSFPINIQMKLRYRYSPTKNIDMTPPSTDLINFKRMTGNEILLNMQNAAHFRDQEVIECLRCFLLQDGVYDHDWEENELFQHFLKRITSKFSGFTSENKAVLIRTFKKLKIKNPDFWQMAFKQFMLIHPSLKGKYFGYFFVDLLSRPDCSEELKVEMTKLLPRELETFSANDITASFKIVVDNDLLNERLWHNHFHIIFWRKPRFLRLENFPTLIDYMVKIDYLEETDWWNNSFLPNIDYYLNKSVKVEPLAELIASLERLNAAAPQIETQSYVKKLNERIVYLKTKYVLLQTAQFHNMVQQDLEYYKEKQLARRELNV